MGGGESPCWSVPDVQGVSETTMSSGQGALIWQQKVLGRFMGLVSGECSRVRERGSGGLTGSQQGAGG